MIRLQILGGMGLEDPERPDLSQLLGQPKAFALLCYLALAGSHRFRRRDAVIGLFWPDLDHEHGRAALRQTLRVLRRALGNETVVNRGDEDFGLDQNWIWCDATAFEQLSEAGEAEQAMLLYRGDLIDRMHVAGAAPELSHWLDGERQRLRKLAQEMAWRCSRQRGAAGFPIDAVHWARRAVHLEPFDERSLRSLLQLLDQTGDRASAVLEYEQFAARLAQQFEVQPASETQSLIANIRGRLQYPAVVPFTARGPATAQAEVQSSPSATAPAPSSTTHSLRPRLLLTLLGLMLVLGLAAALRHGRPAALQPSLVAVMPWRTSGADPSLAYLHEGMLDLLDATLTGERGLHSADPRTVLRAWHAAPSAPNEDVSLPAALEIARVIGAGRLIQGSVVGNPGHLTLEASEFAPPSARPILTVSVTGSLDSLPQLIERLTAQLLAHESGDPAQRRSLTTRSIPALRVYLEGRAAYRRGLYGEAARDFDQALTLDSTFTLAALELGAGGLTLANGSLLAKGRLIAWQDSSRLSPRDRALLIDVVGPKYPAPSDEREFLAARERAVVLAPESPEAAYWLGDSFFHHGRLLQLPDWRARAIAGFERAIRLDSAYAEPYEHLIEIKLQVGDSVGVRNLAATYFAMDSTGEYGDYLRWRVALALADSAGLAALRARFGRMSGESLYRIVGDAQTEGIALDDAERAVNSLEAQAGDDRRRTWAAYASEALASNEGRPSAALTGTVSMTADPRRPLADRWFRVADAIYSDGDSIAAERAIAELTPLADARIRPAAPDSQDVATCAVALWQLHRHDTRGLRNAIRRLRKVPTAEPIGFGVWMNACATIVEAQLAQELGAPDTLSTLIRLDSLVNAGPTLASPLRVAATLVLARLQEQRGDLRAALGAVRRRENEYSPRYLSTQLLQEGRLAALLGERSEAIRAYQHYLALRFDPEPSLQPSVDSIRVIVAILQQARS